MLFVPPGSHQDSFLPAWEQALHQALSFVVEVYEALYPALSQLLQAREKDRFFVDKSVQHCARLNRQKWGEMLLRRGPEGGDEIERLEEFKQGGNSKHSASFWADFRSV